MTIFSSLVLVRIAGCRPVLKNVGAVRQAEEKRT